jgi:hypothetical protein
LETKKVQIVTQIIKVTTFGLDVLVESILLPSVVVTTPPTLILHYMPMSSSALGSLLRSMDSSHRRSTAELQTGIISKKPSSVAV